MAPEDLVPDAPAGGRTRAALEREKALVLRSIKELEFDHAMRKTAVGDYEEMRDRLKVRAVGLLRQLDHAGYREAVERDLAARDGAPATAVMAPATPAPAAAPGPQACAACHTINEPDARFCKACGAALAGPA